MPDGVSTVLRGDVDALMRPEVAGDQVRQLVEHPAQLVDVDELARVTGSDPARTLRTLDRLVSAGVLEPPPTLSSESCGPGGRSSRGGCVRRVVTADAADQHPAKSPSYSERRGTLTRPFPARALDQLAPTLAAETAFSAAASLQKTAHSALPAVLSTGAGQGGLLRGSIDCCFAGACMEGVRRSSPARGRAAGGPTSPGPRQVPIGSTLNQRAVFPRRSSRSFVVL